MEKLERALRERIYLLTANQSTNLWEFTVKGQSSKIYTQKLTPESFSCTCPDHYLKKGFCKHLLFLLSRVANQTEIAVIVCENKSKWNDELFMICSVLWLERLKSRQATVVSQVNEDIAKKLKDAVGENCSVCFEEICANDRLLICETTCKNVFHNDCLQMWFNTGHDNCPLCRAKWKAEKMEEGVDGISNNLQIKLSDDVMSGINATPAQPQPIVNNLLLMFETTKQIYPAIYLIQKHADMIVNDYFNNIEGLKMGVITFENTLDFTDDKQVIIDFIRGIQYTGLRRYEQFKNDESKIMVDSLDLSWKIEAKSKHIIMLCDCMRFNTYTGIIDTPNKFNHRNINIYVIGALYYGEGHSFDVYNKLVKNYDNNQFVWLFQLNMVNDYLKVLGLKIAGKDREILEMEKELRAKYGNISTSIGWLYTVICNRLPKERFHNMISPYEFHQKYGYNQYMRHNDLDETKYEKESLTLNILIHSGLVAKPNNKNEFMELRKKYYNIEYCEYEEYKKYEKRGLLFFPNNNCPLMKYQLLEVDEDCLLTDFCKKYHLKMKKGKMFSELKKKENIDPEKDIVVYNKPDGELTENVKSRILLKLSDTLNKEKVSPSQYPDYRIFVECGVRKILKQGDTIMYRI
jgi:hypothetical protein